MLSLKKLICLFIGHRRNENKYKIFVTDKNPDEIFAFQFWCNRCAHYIEPVLSKKWRKCVERAVEHKL
jgi:hypothetical protein